MTTATDTQAKIIVPASINMVSLLGSADEHLRVIERSFPAVDLHVRGNEITVNGVATQVALVEQLFAELLTVVRTGQGLTRESVERSIGMLRENSEVRPAEVLTANILSNRGRTIRPKTLNQKRYVDAIDVNTIVFGIGSGFAGEGRQPHHLDSAGG